MALVNFCRIIPDGLLVFFPSYALLEASFSHYKVLVCCCWYQCSRVFRGKLGVAN